MEDFRKISCISDSCLNAGFRLSGDIINNQRLSMIVHSANFDKIDFFSVSDFQRFSTALILV